VSTALAPTVPPQDIDAEESVLGSMMLSERAVSDVTEVITDPTDFYREAHGTIFRAMQHLLARSEPVDAITVTSELAKMGRLDEVGGAPFVHGLSATVPAASNARQYARIVHDLAVFRRLVNAGVAIAQLGYERGGEVGEAVDQAESIVFQVAQARVGSDLLPVSELLVEEFERIDKLQASGSTLTGTPTGLKGLDNITSGLQPSNLIILAARPSMGKTALALGLARHVGAERNIPVAVFSLEMSRYEIVQRLMCSQALVDSQRLRTGRMQSEDWARLTSACDQLMRAPIYIDDSAGATVMEIRSKARRLKAQQPTLGLIVIDYLQLMGSSDRPESRVQEISQISRAMKVLARDLQVPVVALSQLSRAVESRTDKRPMLSDLRESGSIEQDADVVMFIYRDDYYNREESEKKGLAELIVAKHRNGATGTVDLAFRERYTIFSDLARGEG
jgi:replicative DNA helicase